MTSSDGGVYKCNATNRLGSRQSKTLLVIVESEADLLEAGSWANFYDFEKGVGLAFLLLFFIIIVSIIWLCVLCRLRHHQRMAFTADTELSEYQGSTPRSSLDEDHPLTSQTSRFHQSDFKSEVTSRDCIATCDTQSEPPSGGFTLSDYLRLSIRECSPRDSLFSSPRCHPSFPSTSRCHDVTANQPTSAHQLKRKRQKKSENDEDENEEDRLLPPGGQPSALPPQQPSSATTSHSTRDPPSSEGLT